MSQFPDHASKILPLSKKYQKNIIKRTLAPMTIYYISDEIGYGVKAAKKIYQGDFIGIYAGKLRLLSTEDQEDTTYAWAYTVPDTLNRLLTVDAKKEGNDLRFINHSFDPNVEEKHLVYNDKFYICYLACKDIPKDFELLVNYGKEYWESYQKRKSQTNNLK